jgi:hypothetical protein
MYAAGSMTKPPVYRKKELLPERLGKMYQKTGFALTAVKPSLSS